MEKARLDKIIAGEGTYSRREVRLLVRQGRVLVDGVPARSPEDKVVPEAVEIMVDGTVLHCRRYTWIMLHKPAGVIALEERFIKILLRCTGLPIRCLWRIVLASTPPSNLTPFS